MKLTRATLESIPIERPPVKAYHRQHMCLDKGFDYDEVYALLDEFGYTAHVRSRGEEAKELKQDTRKRARRWVVERTHSWINRYRRLLVRWEKKLANYLGLLHFSFGLIALRGAGVKS